MADVFAWLAQEPIQTDYKGGTIYMRAEINEEGLPTIHFIYKNGLVFLEKWLEDGVLDMVDVGGKILFVRH